MLRKAASLLSDVTDSSTSAPARAGDLTAPNKNRSTTITSSMQQELKHVFQPYGYVRGNRRSVSVRLSLHVVMYVHNNIPTSLLIRFETHKRVVTH